jgi:predicted 3-demethylubiquinone-9 3-methyltransferase (glyoxalase superfamily)
MTTCLWFNGNAEEAANFYISVLGSDAKILMETRYSAESAKASGQPEGSVMTVIFRLRGREFMGLNGGPRYKFNRRSRSW